MFLTAYFTLEPIEYHVNYIDKFYISLDLFDNLLMSSLKHVNIQIF